MQKLTFINDRSESFILSYGVPFALRDLIGLSDMPVSLLSYKGYNQDGQKAAGQFFQARPVSFSVSVIADTVEEVFEKRRQLLKYFNPKDTFSVIYENDYITVKFVCRIDGPPRFASTQSTPGYTHQTCTVSLICDDPYLTDVDETVVTMRIEEPRFNFPLMFFDEIIMSVITGKKVEVNNNGDVATPLRMQFTGPSLNPKVTNETTGEYIQVAKTILTDEVLEISTGYGDKKVEIIKPDGSRENAFNFIDLSSSFFQLIPGENIISYEAESGADSAQVFLYYKNRYVGV